MAKPYAHLRALMSPDAQQQAEEKARALLASTPTPAPDACAQGQVTDDAQDDDV